MKNEKSHVTEVTRRSATLARRDQYKILSTAGWWDGGMEPKNSGGMRDGTLVTEYYLFLGGGSLLPVK